MIRHILNSLLIISFLLPSVPVSAAKSETQQFLASRDCAEGKCIDRLTGLLEAKINEANREHCLPPSSVKNKEAWFESRQMSVSCYRQLKAIDELYEKLEEVQNYLTEVSEKGTCVNCGKNETPVSDILANIEDIDSANNQLSCSAERKKEIWHKCGTDAMCVLISSSLTVLGPLANKMIPSSLKTKGCNATQDSCLTQLAMGFVKSVFSLFEGAWDLLKTAGSYTKDKITDLWHWVSDAEDKSSTAQLAAAKASENEGIFHQLMHDFSGTMAKLWTGLLAAIKEWLRSSVFCQEWSGVPQFSTCKHPAQGLDCLECKTMITGMCSITGTIVAEIIPAFLTGGLVIAAKYGAEGAVEIAKLFKVSAATAKAIKESKIAQMAVKTSTKVTEAVKTAKVTATVGKAATSALSVLKTFLLKPIAKIAKASLVAMKASARSAKVYIVTSKVGPTIIFGTKALTIAGKVVIFPFDNAMLTKSFEIGEKSMELVIKKSKGLVVASGRPLLKGEAARSMVLMDQSYKEVVLAKISRNPKQLQIAEENYFKVIQKNRGKIIDSYLLSGKKIKFDELIEDFYPELNYSKTKGLSPKDITKAESELWSAISGMPKGKTRDSLTLSYQNHVASMARHTRKEVLKNASLSHKEKIEKVIKLTGRKISSTEEQSIAKALKQTEVVSPQGVLKYSADDVAKQNKILTDAGLTKDEASQVVNSGLAGKVKDEDQFANLRKVAVPSDDAISEVMKHPEYEKLFISVTPEQKPAIARAIKVLENNGGSEALVAETFKRFEKNFNHVQALGGKDSDAASMLAEYINRQKKAGLADEAIQKKIDKAFGECK